MKKFMMIWAGELISCIGSGMTSFAIAIYVYQLTQSAAWVSIAALLAYLPTILLSPIGGVLADRYDRRLMMILGDALSALGLILIFVSIQTGHESIGIVCIGLIISSVFVALLEPAYKATVTDLLTEDEYAKASGLVQIAGNAKYLISPALAGVILHVADIRAILIIDICTFFITVTVVFLARKGITSTQKKVSGGFIQELKDGSKYVLKDAGVRNLVILMAFMCFFMAFIQTLMVPMMLPLASEKTLGILESISAIGMVIGSIVIGCLHIKRNFTKILQIGLMAAGIFMALVGTTTKIGLILTFCILFFCALPFVNTCADVLIRMRIPNEVQGRAWGIISILTQIGYVFAYALCGFLADYVFGPMLMEDGILANSIGKVIGTGEGRGIGFMLMITGVIMFAFAFIFGAKKSIKNMEEESHELAHDQK